MAGPLITGPCNKELLRERKPGGSSFQGLFYAKTLLFLAIQNGRCYIHIMKILFIEWESFGNENLKVAMMEEGHSVVCFPFSINDKHRQNPEAEARLSGVLRGEVPDAVFSFNYFPVISKVCQTEGVRYLSWVYDCPAIMLYSCTIVNSCNTVYVFDREVYREFHEGGIHTVHYLPMASDITGTEKPFSCLYDISFVGSLYTERWNFFDQMTDLSDYARGYLDALMNAQRLIQGYNFIQETLGPVMEDLQKAFPMSRNEDGIETMEWFYAQYLINRKITSLERMDLLSAVAQLHPLDLFTHDQNFAPSGVRNHGSIDYGDRMREIFRRSRINLNITLRSIQSGIPLRAFDVMGSGGFLLSNFQADFLEYFVPGEDFVVYESREDLLCKISYYLAHEEERKAIARSGQEKVAAGHTYQHRVREMFDF